MQSQRGDVPNAPLLGKKTKGNFGRFGPVGVWGFGTLFFLGGVGWVGEKNKNWQFFGTLELWLFFVGWLVRKINLEYPNSNDMMLLLFFWLVRKTHVKQNGRKMARDCGSDVDIVCALRLAKAVENSPSFLQPSDERF